MASSTSRRESRSFDQCVIMVTSERNSSRNSSTLSFKQRRIHAVIRAILRVIRIRSVLAFALMFWCAGTGCMMVSYARAASADSSAANDVFAHAMAGSMSTDAHACCKAKRPSTNTHHGRAESKSTSSVELNLLMPPSSPTQTGAMNCCPLTSGSIVVSSQSQSNDNSTVSQQTDSSSPLLVESDHAPLAVPLRLPNRAHSYLLDCAFLI